MAKNKSIAQNMAGIWDFCAGILGPIVIMLALGLAIDNLCAPDGVVIGSWELGISWTLLLVIIGILAAARNFYVWARKRTKENEASESRRGFGDAAPAADVQKPEGDDR